MAVTHVDVDLESPDVVRDPYPVFAQLRAAGGAVFHDRLGMYLAASYEDANAVLRSRALGRIWVDREPADVWETFNWLHSDSILESEPPKHTRLRALVAEYFVRGRVDKLRPAVEEIAERVLDDAMAKAADEGRFDLIADYAEPLSVEVIATMLGIPAGQRDGLRPWSQAIVKMYDYAPTADDQLAAQRAAAEFAAFVDELAENKRAEPRDDLLSEVVQAQDRGADLSGRELVALGVLLLNAGHEASVNGFGNGIVAVCRDGDSLAAATGNGTLPVESIVEEMLRFDSPLQLFERTAKDDVQVAGVTLRRGEKIAALLGSANSDPSAFSHADELVLDREPNPHIAFGSGIHFCVGAPLARLELSVALRTLLERAPALRLVGEPVRRRTFVLRGYHSIPVAVAG